MTPTLPRAPGIDRLSAHHLHALAVAVLIDRYLKVDPTPGRLAEIAGKVAGFAEKELFPHFQVEETALFPALRQALDSDPLIDQCLHVPVMGNQLVDQRIGVERLPQRG